MPSYMEEGELNLLEQGEMARRVREFNWATTGVGPRDKWPAVLATAVNMILAIRFPIVIFWGPKYVTIYNDAYIDVLGPKHPCLGRTGADVYEEFWAQILPEFKRAELGGSVLQYDRHLPMLRRGYLEETYFVYTLSPLSDSDGVVQGIIGPSFEVTKKVFQERREACLRDLGSKCGKAHTVSDAVGMASASLQDAKADFPFALVYLIEGEEDQAQAVLRGSSGIPMTHHLAPSGIPLGRNFAGSGIWPIREAITSGEACEIYDLNDPSLPGGIWEETPTEAIVHPLYGTQLDIIGCLVMGCNPRRRLDQDYRNFFTLVTRQIGVNIAAARNYEEEKKKQEALAAIDRAKTAFFSNVSHEFRTPLTLILGPLEKVLRENEDLPVGVREELGIAQRNSQRLLKLVTSLLDFSRIEAGRMQASFRPVDLAAFVSDLAGVFRSAIGRAQLEFRMEVPPSGRIAYIDTDLFEKVIYNMLSNAIKCTLRGSITVGYRETDAGPEITVSDTGCGIKSEDLPKIFDRFFRAEATERRSTEGSGIGLALTQELVHLHGGQIRAESKVGSGTSFVVTLPWGKSHLAKESVTEVVNSQSDLVTGVRDQFLEEAMGWLGDASSEEKPATPETEAEKSETTHAYPVSTGSGQSTPLFRPPSLPRKWTATGAHHIASASKTYILVADDNRDMAFYVKKLLSPIARVHVVHDGEQALARCRQYPPSLLLSDVMMPKIDGLELARAVRADKSLNFIPVILLSARAGEEAKVEGMGTGADDYMCKPFSAKELIARVRAHLELGRLRKELFEFANICPVGIMRTDAAGGNIFRSTKMQELSGTAAHDLFLQNVHPDDIQYVMESWDECRRQKDPGHIEFRYQHPDGRVVCVLSQWTAEVDESGRVIGFVGAITDITERTQMQQKQLKEVEDDRVALDRLIDMICHEIRNPLNAIYNNTDLLRTGVQRRRDILARILSGATYSIDSATDQFAFDEECLDAIESAARHQRVIADDVLHLSKLRNGPMAMNNKLFDPLEILGSVVQMFRAECVNKGVKLDTEVEWEVGQVWGDPARIKQILINLLSNAVKFTQHSEKKSIILRVYQLQSEEGSSLRLAFKVIDTGIGMSAAAQGKLFKRFSQVGLRTHQDYGGSGLGLHISRQMIQVMGGEIGVESELGKGTTFWFYVCVELDQKEDLGSDHGDSVGSSITAKQPPNGMDLSKTKTDAPVEAVNGLSPTKESDRGTPICVLVVEDNLINQRVIKRQLELAGYKTYLANDGSEAVMLVNLHREEIDVILMDVEMPIMDGIEATRRIRQSESHPNSSPNVGDTVGTQKSDGEEFAKNELCPSSLPILGLSGNARTEHRDVAVRAGMNDYVVKPYEKASLFKLITSYATKRRENRELWT